MAELCFCINEKELYLEKVLVDYMEIPVFFLCRNDKGLCLALCEDIDELRYLLVSVSNMEVYDLLNGKTPMRDIFLKQKNCWEVISGEEITSDLVTEYPVSAIRKEVLPKEGACFEALTDDLKEYVRRFNEKLFETEDFQEFSNGVLNRGIKDIIDWEIINCEIDFEKYDPHDQALRFYEYLQLYRYVAEGNSENERDKKLISVSYEELISLSRNEQAAAVPVREKETAADWNMDDLLNEAA